MRQCDAVIHLAASVGVRDVIDYPLDSLLNNLRCSETVFASALRWEKKVFFASSSEVYGEAGIDPVTEESRHNLGPPWIPRWSYGYGKSLEEALLFSYGAQLGLPLVVGRFFNPSGPRHSKGVIPAFVKQALRGGPVTVYGDGEQRRCFCHIDDLIDAVMMLLVEPIAVGRVFNIGTARSATMNELAALVVEETGTAAEVVHVPFRDAYDEMFKDIEARACDASLLESLTGWHPTKDVTDIVRDVVSSMTSEIRVGNSR
jgi:nucleoside-diphosphate-sugar epimerase